MDTIAELTVRNVHMRENYFSYDGCEIFPQDTCKINKEEQVLILAADVLIDILENMRSEDL